MKAVDFVANVSDGLGWGDVTTIETDDASVRKIVRATNLVLRSMQVEQDWQGLRVRNATLITQEPLSSDENALIGVGETDMQLPGTVLDLSELVGTIMRVGTSAEYYRVVAVPKPAFIRLDRPWTSAALVGSPAVELYFARDTYQLPVEYDRVISARLTCTTTGNDATICGEDEIEHAREQGLVFAEPGRASVEGRTPAGKAAVVLDPVPDAQYVYVYDYQQNHPLIATDTQEILYPERYALAIVDQVVARLNRDVENQQKAIADSQQALSEKVKQGANPDSGQAKQRITPWTGRGRRGY